MTEKKKYNQKVTIQDVYDYCNKEEVNFNFIGDETELANSRSKLTFMCMTCNSSFTKDFAEIKSRKQTQCGSCGRKARGIRQKEQSFKETLELCNELGLKCLSKTFNGMHDDLEFECTSCLESFLRRPIVLKKDRVTICRNCSYKRHGNGLKYSYNEVYNIFKNGGCMLLSKEYKSNKQKLEYICECGEVATIALSNFMYGQRCEICARIKRANSKRTPYEEVKRLFEDEDCILLSTKFINSTTPLDYVCSCGNKSSIRLPAFKYGVRCSRCGENEKKEFEHIRDYFEKYECELISTEYINNKSKLDYICTCGELNSIAWDSFIRSPYKKCRKCANKLNGERIKGENHPSWNPLLTDEDRLDRRLDNRNKIWRYSVYKRDNYTCQCCGAEDGEINAHHKDGYHWCKDKRYDIENGITLCGHCHRDFHGIYGYKNNTEAQIIEYLEMREKEVI